MTDQSLPFRCSTSVCSLAVFDEPTTRLPTAKQLLVRGHDIDAGRKRTILWSRERRESDEPDQM